MMRKRITISNIFVVIVTIISFFPFYMMLVMGTYYSADLFTGMPIWFSDYFLGNLRTILQSDFLSTYRNSVIVSFCSVFFSVFTSVTIGYSIAKFKFRLKKIFLAIILLGMMMPTQISIIGYVIEMRVFHWSNTLMAVICVWIANPFSAFFMAQFIKDSVPDELLESARMDGCSEPGILARIVFPCIRSGVMTIATLVFLWSWNNYLLPLIILNKDSVYTLPLMISNIGAAYQHDYGAQMLALSLSTFPVLIIFSFGSKYFIKGITAGAIKA